MGYFINNYMHLGCSTTSRVEGNHRQIKSHIFTMRVDFLLFVERIDNMILNQFTDLKDIIDYEQKRVNNIYNQSIYSNLTYVVSDQRLKLIRNQILIIDNVSVKEFLLKFLDYLVSTDLSN